jgi:hypothetical protein
MTLKNSSTVNIMVCCNEDEPGLMVAGEVQTKTAHKTRKSARHRFRTMNGKQYKLDGGESAPTRTDLRRREMASAKKRQAGHYAAAALAFELH